MFRQITGTLCAGLMMLSCMSPALAKESPPPSASPAASVTRSGEDTHIIGGVCYAVQDGKAAVTGIRTDGEIIVPAEIKGVPVTEIGPYAFEDWDLDALELPGSLEVIDKDAFARATFGEIRFDGTLAAFTELYSGTAGGRLHCTDGTLNLVNARESEDGNRTARPTALPSIPATPALQSRDAEGSEADETADPAQESGTDEQPAESQSVTAQEADGITYSLDADAVIETPEEDPEPAGFAIDRTYTGLSTSSVREMQAEASSKVRIVLGYSKLPQDDLVYSFKAMLMKRLGDGRTVNVQDAYGPVGRSIGMNHFVQRDEFTFSYVPAMDEAGEEYFLRYEMWRGDELLDSFERPEEVITVTAPPAVQEAPDTLQIIGEETGISGAIPKLQAGAYFGMPVNVAFTAEEGKEYRVTADVTGKYGTVRDTFGKAYHAEAFVTGGTGGKAEHRFFFTLHLPEEYTDQQVYVTCSVDEIGDGAGAQYYAAKDQMMFVRPEVYPMPCHDPEQKAKILTGKGGLASGTRRVLTIGRETVLPSEVSYAGLEPGSYMLTADLMDTKTHTAAGISASVPFTAGKSGTGTVKVDLPVTAAKDMKGGQYYLRYRITGDKLRTDSGIEPFRRQTLEVQADADKQEDTGLYISGPQEARTGDTVRILVYSPTEGIHGRIVTENLEYLGHESTGSLDMSGAGEVLLVGRAETGSEIVYIYTVTGKPGETAEFTLFGADTNDTIKHNLQAGISIEITA